MAKLILKFDERVLKECGLEADVTIGRLPDNTIVIDNPAVSGHHARIVRDDDHYVIEDLRSKNGTYVNQIHVTRQRLNNGDVLLVGKHTLVFDEASGGSPAAAERVVPTMGPTAYLDTKQHRALLARLREARALRAAHLAKSAAPAAAPEGAALLRVLAGAAGQSEYRLDAHTSVIGKSEHALIRLHGWFKPKAAAAVVREHGKYVVSTMECETLVNGDRVDGCRDLENGDVIEVAGLVLEFHTSGAVQDDSRHRPNVA